MRLGVLFLNRIKLISAGILSGLTFFFSSVVSGFAEIVFESGGGNGSFGFLSDLDGHRFSGQQQIGYEFLLKETVELEQIQWSGQYFPNGKVIKNQFSVRIFEIVNGTPETQPKIDLPLDEIRLTESGIERFSHPVFNYVAVVKPIPLNAGRYLLSIVNNTREHTDDWLWMTSDPKTEQMNGDLKIFFREGDDQVWKLGLTGIMSIKIVGKPVSSLN